MLERGERARPGAAIVAADQHDVRLRFGHAGSPFTYNLVQYFGELGAAIRVFRNDRITLDELIALKPDHLVISPGPGEPNKDGGISAAANKHLTGKIPVLEIGRASCRERV